jgi:hypothetical protein
MLILLAIHIHNKNRWCILLTTCVNRKSQTQEEREKLLAIYRRSISDWLTKTALPICVVDSSNYDFSEFKDTRLIVVSFLYEKIESSTVSECISILYALNNSRELKSYENILKITGRYYIPDITSTLYSIVLNYDLYLQATRTPNLQNSEVFGFKRILGDDIFTPLADKTDTLSMEESIWNISHTDKYTSYVLPYLQNIYKVPRGGDKRILDPL